MTTKLSQYRDFLSLVTQYGSPKLAADAVGIPRSSIEAGHPMIQRRVALWALTLLEVVQGTGAAG